MDDKTYRRSLAAVVAVGAAIAIGTVTGTAASLDRIAAHAKSDVAAAQTASDDSSSSMDEQLLGPHADTTGTQDAENAAKQDTGDSDTKGTDSTESGTKGTKSDATGKDSTKQDAKADADGATKADADAGQTTQAPAPTSGQTDASVGAAAGSAKIQTYDVQWGDTLSGVSRSTGVSVDDLARENGIEDVNLIYAGSSLRVPQD